MNPEDKIGEILDYVELDYDRSCFSYLDKLSIRNRNKKDKDYYTLSEIEEINSILNLNIH